MRSRDHVPAVGPGNRSAEHFPFVHGRESDIGPYGLFESLGHVLRLGQIRVGECLLCHLVHDRAVTHHQCVGIDLPLPGRKLGQQLARGRGRLAHRRHVLWRRPAAGRDAIVRHEVRVGHNQADSPDGDAQFFRGGLR